MNPNNRKTFAIVAVLVLLAGVGAVAYARRNSNTAPAVNTLSQPAFGQPSSPQTYNDPNVPQQQGYAQTSQGYVQGQAAGYIPGSTQGYAQSGYRASAYEAAQTREDGYYSSIRRPIYVHNAMEYQPQREVIRESDQTYVEPGTTVVQRRNTYVTQHPTYYREDVRHGRSTGKSVAIVAGTAGVGAAIGALAGGGKGAAIGALSGGGAGFVYDRMTHNHVR